MFVAEGWGFGYDEDLVLAGSVSGPGAPQGKQKDKPTREARAWGSGFAPTSWTPRPLTHRKTL